MVRTVACSSVCPSVIEVEVAEQMILNLNCRHSRCIGAKPEPWEVAIFHLDIIPCSLLRYVNSRGKQVLYVVGMIRCAHKFALCALVTLRTEEEMAGGGAQGPLTNIKCPK